MGGKDVKVILLKDGEPIAREKAAGGFDQGKVTEELLEKAIEKLPPIYRGVFILKDIEGFSHEEISKMLDISIPAVKTRLLRARLFLRSQLSDYFH